MNQDDLEDVDEKLPFYPLNWINATSDGNTWFFLIGDIWCYIHFSENRN